ncbi:TIGR01244 family phosphatase [Ciceribacter sp. L1K23]|uniref:TIGR01244 family sulfur transferase n=1 Tax=Ciceribacter sp. L1K23 TaxID=2820276 RepID=UPI001B843513|nr:TIGR01244 family sulfur transferase [Ciceribacter sp. L1K23]MBR0557245.1 TIGR01244 family phosphatase [Ciceribacter sp. L1K23]
MHIREITPTYHVTGQIKPADLPAIAAAGYTTIICMRPDGEGWGQPKFALVSEAAAASGLSAHYLPVGGSSVPMEQAAKLKALLTQTQGPILAFCASGARSAGLYQMAQQIG